MNESKEFCIDIRNFNYFVNTNKSKLTVFWSAVAQVVETDTGTGAHMLRHAAVDEERTNKILYAPNVLSIQELMDTAKEPLTKTDEKKEGVGFLVPSLLWLYLQLYPSYEN